MDFKKRYKRENQIEFFRDYCLPEDFESTDEEIKIDFKSNHFRKITKIGEVSSLNLIIYEIKHKSENDPRVSLSRDSFRLLSQFGQQKALILFISESSPNYRFSLVTIDLKWEGGKRVSRGYSNPRRYSFFLGPDAKTHTPEEYIVKPGRVTDFENLKKRFSIEVVNKDFYTQIAILFTKLAGGERTIGRQKYDEKGNLKLPSTVDETIRKEFTVRLLGRLVFCWFLKKKQSENGVSLLPETILSSKALNGKRNFYHNILEPLFFQVLNTPIDNRKRECQEKPWCFVPFLNGGLFNPQLHDFYETGNLGISKHINTLKVPDKWLRELLELFETYNFTIDENTSIDIELSIDPEMLGRIFENLLAEINPETGKTARKSTGSYYTPRPIVEYMVDESLKQYLITTIQIAEDKILSLLSYEVEEIVLSDVQKEKILDALDSIKIIDPACGSGAFPMGILQKMLLILQKIDPDSKQWLHKQILKIDKPFVRKEMEKKLKTENVNYIHKLGIIQYAIYGVDIQPIAVEISKLRFFLSLIVDERIDDNKENRGIQELPNLEFKFVCANSLAGLPEVKKQGEMFESEEINFLEELRQEYLKSYGKEKKNIEKEFLATQNKMLKHSLSWGAKESKTLKLSKWNPFTDESCDWFDPMWMFGVKDGFDIVIANPPYVEHKKLKHLSAFLKENFNIYAGTADLYVYFYEKGFSLLKNRGILTFISSNKFTKTRYGKNLRGLLSSYSIKQIIDFTKLQVFDALVDSCVLIIQKEKTPEQFSVSTIDNSLKDLSSLADFIKTNHFIVHRDALSSEIWQLKDASYLSIKSKIERGSEKLGDIDGINIYRGVTTGCNEAFLIDKSVKKQLIKDDPQSREIIKPLLQGRNIRKWIYEKSNMFLLQTDYDIDIPQKYPSIFNYLNMFKEDLVQRTDQGENWWNLRSCVYYSEFEKDKIIWGLTADKWAFAYDDNSHYLPSNGYILTSNSLSLSFLLAILNSSLMQFYFSFIGIMTAGGAFTLKYETIKELPFKEVSSEEQQDFTKIVEKILKIVQSNNFEEVESKREKIKEYEHAIDKMVYELYGLNKKEIEIVKNFQNK